MESSVRSRKSPHGYGGLDRTGHASGGAERKMRLLTRTYVVKYVGHAEVCDLCHTVLREQHVLRLKVSMDDVVGVQELLGGQVGVLGQGKRYP